MSNAGTRRLIPELSNEVPVSLTQALARDWPGATKEQIGGPFVTDEPNAAGRDDHVAGLSADIS